MANKQGTRRGTGTAAQPFMKQSENGRNDRGQRKKKGLTPMQALFAVEYLKDHNGKQAAIRAGASPRSAEVTACKWLRMAKVKAAVSTRLEKCLEAVDFKVEDVLRAIGRHVKADGRADPRDFVDEHGNLQNIKDLSSEAAMNIGGFDIVKRNLTSGDGLVDTVIKVKIRDQSRYVELGAKYFGLLVEQIRVSGTIDLEERVAAVRQRLATKKNVS